MVFEDGGDIDDEGSFSRTDMAMAIAEEHIHEHGAAVRNFKGICTDPMNRLTPLIKR